MRCRYQMRIFPLIYLTTVVVFMCFFFVRLKIYDIIGRWSSKTDNPLVFSLFWMIEILPLVFIFLILPIFMFQLLRCNLCSTRYIKLTDEAIIMPKNPLSTKRIWINYADIKKAPWFGCRGQLYERFCKKLLIIPCGHTTFFINRNHFTNDNTAERFLANLLHKWQQFQQQPFQPSKNSEKGSWISRILCGMCHICRPRGISRSIFTR